MENYSNDTYSDENYSDENYSDDTIIYIYQGLVFTSIVSSFTSLICLL